MYFLIAILGEIILNFSRKLIDQEWSLEPKPSKNAYCKLICFLNELILLKKTNLEKE